MERNLQDKIPLKVLSNKGIEIMNKTTEQKPNEPTLSNSFEQSFHLNGFVTVDACSKYN